MKNINISYRFNPPCKGCEKRAMYCHGSCPEYLAAKAKAAELAREINRERDLQNDVTSFEIENQLKIKKRRGGK